jgi:hypothetical protein
LLGISDTPSQRIGAVQSRREVISDVRTGCLLMGLRRQSGLLQSGAGLPCIECPEPACRPVTNRFIVVVEALKKKW